MLRHIGYRFAALGLLLGAVGVGVLPSASPDAARPDGIQAWSPTGGAHAITSTGAAGVAVPGLRSGAATGSAADDAVLPPPLCRGGITGSAPIRAALLSYLRYAGSGYAARAGLLANPSTGPPANLV